MSYELPTPGRTHHERWLHIPRRIVLKDPPQVATNGEWLSGPGGNGLDFSQPDDRGALVGMGTSRLPLSRHACASILWSFLDPLGTPGTTALAIMQRAKEDVVRQEKALALIVPLTIGRVAIDISDHTMANDHTFKERFSQIVYYVSRINIDHTLHLIMLVYHELSSKHRRPAGLGHGDWVLELQRKKAANWICRWDEQWLVALAMYSTGTSSARKQQHWTAIWYFIRAVIDLAPWYPSEWFLASWEAELPEVQLYMKCISALATSLFTVGYFGPAHALSLALICNPLSFGQVRHQAWATICQCYSSKRILGTNTWLTDRLSERRAILRDLPYSRWPEYQTLVLTRTTFSLEDVASRSLAQNFTPTDLISIVDRCPYLNLPDEPDLLDRAKTELRQNLISQAYRDWNKDPAKPYCWSILEEFDELTQDEWWDSDGPYL